MKLYHYAKEQYPVLLTRRRTGTQMPVGVKVSDSYLDHISFFFDPIPSRLLVSVFDKGHSFWFKGNRIYEHVVDVSTAAQDIKFHAVETPKENALFDVFAEEHNWVGNDPTLLAKWRVIIDAKQREWGELGVGRDKLIRLISQHVGKTADYYRAAKNLPDFESGYAKYAANVAHLMLYPPSGEMSITTINTLVIGDDRRTPLASASRQNPSNRPKVI